VDPPVHPELRPTRTGQSLTTQPPRPDRTTDVEHPDSQVRTTATPSSRSRGPERNQLNVLGAATLPTVPSEQPVPTSARECAVQEWWNRNYLNAEAPAVDFVMLNRLADLIISASPQLQRALRATYPFVFVDEFQDTTYAQYSFLKAVFAHKGTTVTVVGDRKQRIMGWAGALGDAFAQFEVDFGAEPFALTSNFRSTQQLIDLQHRFAVRLDPDSPPQHSRIDPPVGETPVAVWSFPTAQREADAIARLSSFPCTG
jgi:superfamily I DNA/RNA helicase